MPPRYRINPDIVATRLDGEAVLLNLVTQEYFTINETGISIWEMLTEPMAPDEVAAGLLATYDLAEDAAAGAARRFLEELAGDGLIVPAD